MDSSWPSPGAGSAAPACGPGMPPCGPIVASVGVPGGGVTVGMTWPMTFGGIGPPPVGGTLAKRLGAWTGTLRARGAGLAWSSVG